LVYGLGKARERYVGRDSQTVDQMRNEHSFHGNDSYWVLNCTPSTTLPSKFPVTATFEFVIARMLP